LAGHCTKFCRLLVYLLCFIVLGQNPQRVPGAEPLVQGQSHFEAASFVALKRPKLGKFSFSVTPELIIVVVIVVVVKRQCCHRRLRMTECQLTSNQLTHNITSCDLSKSVFKKHYVSTYILVS